MKDKIKSLFKIICWLLLGIIIGALGLFFYNYYLVVKSNKSEVINQSDLILKISKLVILPTGEEPAVATINDAPSLIKEQVFYKNAINGDIVLVYQKAAKAIVYSPSRNIIVNVGPVYLPDNTDTGTSTASTTTNKK